MMSGCPCSHSKVAHLRSARPRGSHRQRRSSAIGSSGLLGNGATILDGVTVGKRALVAAGCTVPPGMVIPDDMLAVGVPARIAGEGAGGAKRWVQNNPQAYRDLAKRHAAGTRPI